MSKSTSKIAVLSGSGGFLGKHLTAYLIKQDIKVAAIPREFLSSPADLKGLLEEYNPNYIFALHSYGNFIDQEDEDETVATNIMKTYLLLQASKGIKYEAFVNVSSSSVSLEYETFYSATKASAERLCRAFATKYDKPIVSCQPYTIFGPQDAPTHLIPTLLRAAKSDESIPFVGEPVHDYVFVSDMVEALLTIAQNAHTASQEPYEVGSGTQHTNQEVLALVERISGKKISTTPYKARNYDTNRWVADMNYDIKKLGWKPKVSLEEGLRRLWKINSNGE